ncbi:unnamed protein product [Alternaria alternata]
MIESPKHMLRDLIKTKDWSAEEEEEEEEEEEDSEKEEDQPRDSYHPWGYTIYQVLLDPYFLPQKNVALEGAPDLATSDAEAPETAQRWCYRHHGFQRFPDTEQQRLRYFGNTYKEWSETKKQWLKCVKVDYVYAEYEQRSRHDRLPFLGWFMTTTGSIAELWETLAGGDILRIDSKVEGVTCK